MTNKQKLENIHEICTTRSRFCGRITILVFALTKAGPVQYFGRIDPWTHTVWASQLPSSLSQRLSVGSSYSSPRDFPYVGHVVMATLWSPGWHTWIFCLLRCLLIEVPTWNSWLLLLTAPSARKRQNYILWCDCLSPCSSVPPGIESMFSVNVYILFTIVINLCKLEKKRSCY